MGKGIFFALLASGAWLFFNKVDVTGLDPRGVGTRLEGRSVVRETSQIETRFARVSSLEDTYVLFGGDAGQRRNQATHASFAGLPLRHAQAIASRHPDFYMCKSPGAAEAQCLTESVNVVAADRSALSELGDAIELFEERLAQGGERTCVHVQGSSLAVDSVRVKENGEDLTAQVAPLYARSKLILAERVEILDCKALLAR